MKTLASTTALLIAFSNLLCAQWPKYKGPGVPRDAQGLVLMEAPPPPSRRRKLDLSGNRIRTDPDPLPKGPVLSHSSPRNEQ